MEQHPDSVQACPDLCSGLYKTERQEQTLNLILQELNTINNTLNTLKKQMNLVLGSRTHSGSEQHVFEQSTSTHDQDISKILIYLDTMDNKIDDIKGSTKNMDNHISFIETVYDTVAQPFMYIFNKLSYKNHIQLPELPCDKKKQIEYTTS